MKILKTFLFYQITTPLTITHLDNYISSILAKLPLFKRYYFLIVLYEETIKLDKLYNIWYSIYVIRHYIYAFFQSIKKNNRL